MVVIPCYDEAKRLDLIAFRAFVDVVKGVEFLFVDDGSKDDTHALLEGLKRERPDAIDVLRMSKNSGKAEAVRQGMLEAIERGCDFVAFWDADLSTGLDEIEPFRNIMRDRPEIEMVFGSRVNLLGRHIDRKLSRHYMSRIFATVVATALRLPIYDTQCGAKMFRVTEDVRRVMADPFLSRWIFDVEIIARFLVLRKSGPKPPVRAIIVEKPLQRWIDLAGSKLRPRDFFRAWSDFIRIYSRYLRQVDGRL
jgi:glycosyltransferase involved in cell wall biosynthesis